MIYPLLGSGYESNCFIVAGEKAAVIDAGNPSGIIEKMGGLNIPTAYLINTHCHYDHVLGLGLLKQRLGGLVAIHELDADALAFGINERILHKDFGAKSPQISVDVRLRDGEVIDLGGMCLDVIHTPGHTPGCICLYEPETKSLFSGDTVFEGSVGRTDFPGGSWDDLKRSIECLLQLHKESGIKTIYPGHGPLTKGEDLRNIYEEYFS